MISRFRLRDVFAPAIGLMMWLAMQQPASAQEFWTQALLAQTGTTKTALGWLIVLLCIGLGLMVVCRASLRQPADWKFWKK
jgi:hypothetical protein